MSMRNVFPFATGSAVTAAFAEAAGFSLNAEQPESASFADVAEVVLNTTGPRGKYICYVTYEQFQQMLAGTHVEDCSV